MAEDFEDEAGADRDTNEEVCGACREGGDLICCEVSKGGCIASYHPRCAGYANIDEVPEGDWFCWGCCTQKAGKSFAHPQAPIKCEVGTTLRVSRDSEADVFYDARVVSVHGGRATIEYEGDMKPARDTVSLTSHRIWHGGMEDKVWQAEEDGGWGALSRRYVVDDDQQQPDQAEVASDPEDSIPDVGARPDSGSDADEADQPPRAARPRAHGVVRHRLTDLGGIAPPPDVDEASFRRALNEWTKKSGRPPINEPICTRLRDMSALALWAETCAWGGEEAVCEHKKWSQIGRVFGGEGMTDLSHVVKKTFYAVFKGFEAAVRAGRTGDFKMPPATRDPAQKLRGVSKRTSAPSASGRRRSGVGAESIPRQRTPKAPRPPRPQGEAAPRRQWSAPQAKRERREPRELGEVHGPEKYAKLLTAHARTRGWRPSVVGWEETQVFGQVGPSEAAKKLLKRGAKVEFRSNDNGFRGGWFAGTVLKTAGGSGIEGRLSALVRSDDFEAEDSNGGRPQDWVPLVSRGPSNWPIPQVMVMIRPRYSVLEPALAARPRRIFEYRVGDVVEGLQEDCWWRATVTEVADGGLNVQDDYPPWGEGASYWIEDPKHVRPLPASEASHFGMLDLPPEAEPTTTLGDLEQSVAPVPHAFPNATPPACLTAFSCREHLPQTELQAPDSEGKTASDQE